MSNEQLVLIIHFLELVAAIIATVQFKKYNETMEKYFLYFLWFTFVVDVAGRIMGQIFIVNNYWLLNGYMLISFLFYFYWYASILQSKIIKRTILSFAIILGAISIGNFIVAKWTGYHKFTFLTGAILTMVCAVFHFRQLLYGDEVLILKHKLSFWISTGLLLFNMGMLPLMLLSDYFDFLGSRFYIVTIISLNVILYGCYIIGFQWTKEKYNRF